MIKYFTGIFISLFALTTAWTQPEFTLSDAQGNPGDVVSVDLKVDHFKDVIGFQFAVKYDNTKLKVVSVKNLNSRIDEFSLDNVDFSRVNADLGLITVSYVNARKDDGFTLPDGDLFFTIEFEIIATENSTTVVDIPPKVDFGEFDRVTEIIDKNIKEIGMSTIPGTITIGEGGAPGRIGLNLGSSSGQQGETVCIPLTVSNFQNVIGTQYSISFDNELLEFVEAKNFDLPGFAKSSISDRYVDSDGALIVSWSTPDTEPISVSEGTKIADLCFRIKKKTGSSSISFTNSPNLIELIVDDGKGSTTTVDGNFVNGKISAGSDGSDDEGGDVECDVSGFSLAASQITAPSRSEVCVNIVGKGIEKMAVLQTLIEWDPKVLADPTLESVNLEVKGEDFNLDKGSEGKAIISWTHKNPFDGVGVTLDDNSILFKLCFEVIGSDGASTDISFTEDDHTFQLAGNISGDTYTFQYCDGSVKVGEVENVTVRKTDPTCYGDKDGSISLTVRNGESPYTYSWKKDGETIGATASLTSLAAGTYTYTVTDASGKELGTGDVTLSAPDEIKIEGEIIAVEQGNDGEILVSVSGGKGDYIYNWSNGSDSKDLTGLDAGSYTLTVTDESGCSVSKEFDLGSGEFNVRISATTDYNGYDVSCKGEADAILRASAAFGTAPYTYEWSNGDETESIQNVGGGEYRVKVTDSEGKTAEARYTVKEPDKIIVRVVTTPSNGMSAGTAKAEVSGGVDPFTYQWNDASPGSTTVFIGSLTEGLYRVAVTDANGCEALGMGRVPVDSRDCFTAVEVMTPNADGLNDELRIACVEGTINTLSVFDRWGALVYKEENYDNRWTGIDSNGKELSDGVYYYVLEVESADGVYDQYKGHVTLLRSLH